MKKQRSRNVQSLLIIASLVMTMMIGALVLRGTSAQAYSYGGHHWDYGNPAYVDFTIRSSIPYDWTASVSAGASAWNGQSSKFRFRAGYANHNLGRLALSSKIIAQTYVREGWGSSRITDRDTDFNSTLPWSTNGSAGTYDVQSIAAHEFGHWLMLDDLYGSGDYWKTMYGVGTLGQTYQRTLEPDDVNGIRAIYGS